MTWGRLETAAVARLLASIASDPGDLVDAYFERRVDAEWPAAESRAGLRVRREEGLAVRLVRGRRAWIASRDRIEGGALVEALRQVARVQPATLPEPELAAGDAPPPPREAMGAFERELERALRRHHVAFPFRVTTRWHRRDIQVVGSLWVPPCEREVFFSLDVELPWGRHGALSTALGAAEAERVARFLVGRFRAREALPPAAGRTTAWFAPAAAAVLVHEAVAHALEADLLELTGRVEGALGLELGPACLAVLDDPRRAPRGVERATDDEGRAVERRWLLRDGKVEQPLADATTAAISERLAPGSGFRGDRHVHPLPRTHHLELPPGEASAEALALAAEGGVHVAEVDGGTLDPATGAVTLWIPWARRVEGGRLGESLGGFRLRTTVRSLLGGVRAIGHDAELAGAGWCAKSGQRRAVWATVPSLVVADLEILR